MQGCAPDQFGFRAFDARNEFSLFTRAGFTLTTRPVLDSTPVDPTVQVQGAFETPDRIAGTWSFPPESASGNFVASRIGGDTATFRITGSFSSAESRAAIVLDVAGNAVSGEAFDVVEGTTSPVTGTIDGNQVSLTAFSGVTATGTLTLDSDGTPTSFQGEFVDGSGAQGDITAGGCRLN
ncbi:MAG: hypothetical protein ACR2RB_18145 [Gammaproteobacteria bacterium]